jgi:hypothetical protein
MEESTHHLRVTLLHVAPRVTRTLLVPSHLSLDRLHQVLQVAMGWGESHLHEYIVGTLRSGERYGPAQRDSSFGFDNRAPRPEKRFTLQQIAPRKGSKFLYWYDFGDDWYHDIVVSEIAAPEPGHAGSRCLEGQGACPPEDCGDRPGTQTFSTHGPTRSTRPTKRFSSGSAPTSIQPGSISMQSTRICLRNDGSDPRARRPPRP